MEQELKLPEMSVAVVNRNTCEHLWACLASVFKESPSDVVVVDNASSDGSADMVQRSYPSVVLLANQTNSGYGAAANQAVASCASRYVLLLNSDTLMQPGALRALGSYLDLHPEVAIVGPRLVNPDGTLQISCFPFPTPLHVFLQESGLFRLVRYMPLLWSRHLLSRPPAQSSAVPWVAGAALAIRRDAFHAVGGFDESYFMYSEEVDLCYRLYRAGWQVHFTPDATVVHVEGASTRQERAAMRAQWFTSARRFYRKHYSAMRQAEFVVIIKAAALARLVRDLARLPMTGCEWKRAWIMEDIALWHHLLLGPWVPGFTHNGSGDRS